LLQEAATVASSVATPVGMVWVTAGAVLSVQFAVPCVWVGESLVVTACTSEKPLDCMQAVMVG
jgi:hypothetical protein